MFDDPQAANRAKVVQADVVCVQTQRSIIMLERKMSGFEEHAKAILWMCQRLDTARASAGAFLRHRQVLGRRERPRDQARLDSELFGRTSRWSRAISYGSCHAETRRCVPGKDVGRAK